MHVPYTASPKAAKHVAAFQSCRDVLPESNIRNIMDILCIHSLAVPNSSLGCDSHGQLCTCKLAACGQGFRADQNDGGGNVAIVLLLSHPLMRVDILYMRMSQPNAPLLNVKKHE